MVLQVARGGEASERLTERAVDGDDHVADELAADLGVRGHLADDDVGAGAQVGDESGGALLLGGGESFGRRARLGPGADRRRRGGAPVGHRAVVPEVRQDAVRLGPLVGGGHAALADAPGIAGRQAALEDERVLDLRRAAALRDADEVVGEEAAAGVRVRLPELEAPGGLEPRGAEEDEVPRGLPIRHGLQRVDDGAAEVGLLAELVVDDDDGAPRAVGHHDEVRGALDAGEVRVNGGAGCHVDAGHHVVVAAVVPVAEGLPRHGDALLGQRSTTSGRVRGVQVRHHLGVVEVERVPDGAGAGDGLPVLRGEVDDGLGPPALDGLGLHGGGHREAVEALGASMPHVGDHLPQQHVSDAADALGGAVVVGGAVAEDPAGPGAEVAGEPVGALGLGEEAEDGGCVHAVILACRSPARLNARADLTGAPLLDEAGRPAQHSADAVQALHGDAHDARDAGGSLAHLGDHDLDGQADVRLTERETEVRHADVPRTQRLALEHVRSVVRSVDHVVAVEGAAVRGLDLEPRRDLHHRPVRVDVRLARGHVEHGFAGVEDGGVGHAGRLIREALVVDDPSLIGGPPFEVVSIRRH